MSDSAILYRGSISPAEAVDRLLVRLAGITRADETVTLEEAPGRVLARDLVAPANLPATNNAAVDGYAVDAAFLARHPDHEFIVAGRAAAGHPFTAPVPEGAAIRIFTGAVMPAGSDAVAMHEFCELTKDGKQVRIRSVLEKGSNNRPAGENLRQGEIIIAAGTRLDAANIAIAAAAGFDQLVVHTRPVIGLLSMGDEIVPAGQPVSYGQMHDSNRPMLANMIRGDGFLLRDFGIIGDDPAMLARVLANALSGCDAVITSGGASDGDEDHTQGAMTTLGVDRIFWRLAIKPGRPMSAGILGDTPLMCLPGNPVAAFVCYRLVAGPVLASLAGRQATPALRLPVRSGFAHRKGAGRAEYLRVVLSYAADGTPVLQRHGRKGAGVLSSLTGADGLVEIPVENEGVAVGDYLPFMPFRETGL